mmetsp:Transcript_16700/g.23027  ORF Transcript_16700/g.23027 Transcript_16700/m.23027 type:complete len:468 (-) Transcript_16700:57-1460(-)
MVDLPVSSNFEPLLGDISESNEPSIQSQIGSIDSTSGGMFQRKHLPLVIGMLSLSFAAASLASIVGPFVPGELSKIDASQTVIGVAFSVYPFALFIGSPVAALLCTRFGQAPVLYFGVVVEGSLSILSGYFHHLSSTNVGRISIFIILRFLQGCGAAASYTSICARLADTFPHNLGQAMGLQEAAAGLGYMLGPVFGAFLYEAGGFVFPFLVMGGVVLTTLLVLPAALRNYTPTIDKSSQGWQEDVEVCVGGSSWRGLGNPGVITGALATVISGIALGFTAPTLPGHLAKLLDVGTVGVGFIFAIPAATYIVSSALAGLAADRFGHEWVMTWGLVGMASSYLMLGPAPFLSALLPSTVFYHWLSQVLSLAGIGIAIGMALIPSMPHMHNSLRAAGHFNASEMSAGVFSSAYSMGECLGPLFGGFVTNLVGFEWATVVIACSILLVTLCTVFDHVIRSCLLCLNMFSK